jgi:hypothetical protein
MRCLASKYAYDIVVRVRRFYEVRNLINNRIESDSFENFSKAIAREEFHQLIRS